MKRGNFNQKPGCTSRRADDCWGAIDGCQLLTYTKGGDGHREAYHTFIDIDGYGGIWSCIAGKKLEYRQNTKYESKQYEIFSLLLKIINLHP